GSWIFPPYASTDGPGAIAGCNAPGSSRSSSDRDVTSIEKKGRRAVFLRRSRRTPPDSGPGEVDPCPEGAATHQPGATPRGPEESSLPQALKGRHKTPSSWRWRACFALSGQGSRSATDSRGVAPGWFVAAPSGRILVVISAESHFS